MEKPSFDPGLTQQYSTGLRRAIKKSGEFNVHRHGLTWRDVHPYLYLINAPWQTFLLIVFLTFLIVNLLFGSIYYVTGIEHLHGAEAPDALHRFLNAFFFSAETLTTVGYGNITPSGLATNFVASFEATLGLLIFALTAGLLFGRVSRPSARLAFSDRMVVAPYQEVTSLQFRLANRRNNTLMELEARVMMMTVEVRDGERARRFKMLELERSTILFLPLSWTIVHPITPESPLWGKTKDDFAKEQAEFLVLIKGFDDTFGQTVFSRYSYTFDEVVWNARFSATFAINEDGGLELELDRLSDWSSIISG